MDEKGQKSELDFSKIVEEADAIKNFQGNTLKIKQKYKELLNRWNFASCSTEEKCIIAFQICPTFQGDSFLQKIFFDLVKSEYKFTREAFVKQVLRDLQSESHVGMKWLMASTILETMSSIERQARKGVVFSDASKVQTILEIILPILDLTEEYHQQMIVDIFKWDEIKAIKIDEFHMKLAELECEKGDELSRRIVFVLLNYAGQKKVPEERLELLRDKCHAHYFKQIECDITGDDVDEGLIQEFLGNWQDLVGYIFNKELDTEAKKLYKYFDFQHLLKFLQKTADLHDFEYRHIVTESVFLNFPFLSDDDKFTIKKKRDTLLNLSSLAQHISESADSKSNQNIGEFIKCFWEKDHDGLLTAVSEIDSADKTSRLMLIAIKYIPGISPQAVQVDRNYFLFRFYLSYLADISKRNNVPHQINCDKGFGAKDWQSFGIFSEMQKKYLAYLKSSPYAVNGKLNLAALPEEIEELDKGFLRYLVSQNLYACFFAVCHGFKDMENYPDMLDALAAEFLNVDKNKVKYHYAFFIKKFRKEYALEEPSPDKFMQVLLAEILAGCEQSEDEELRASFFAKLRVLRSGHRILSEIKFTLNQVDIDRIDNVIAEEKTRVEDMAQRVVDTVLENIVNVEIEDFSLKECKSEDVTDLAKDEKVKVEENKAEVEASLPEKKNNQYDAEIAKVLASQERQREQKKRQKKSSQARKKIVDSLLKTLTENLSFKTEEELFSLASGEKLEKREDNLQRLFEYFKAKILSGTELNNFKTNAEVAERILQAKLELSVLKGEGDTAEIEEFKRLVEQEREKFIQDKEVLPELDFKYEEGIIDASEKAADETDSDIEVSVLEEEKTNSSLDAEAIEKLLADKAELERKVALLTTKTESLEEEKSFQEKLNHDLETQNKELSEKNNQFRDTISFLEDENAALSNQLPEDKKRKKKNVIVEGTYEAEKDKLQHMVSKLSSELNQLKENLESKEKIIADSLEYQQSLSAIVTKQKKEIANLTANNVEEMSSSAKENNEIKKQRSTNQKKVAALKKEGENKDRELNKLRNERERLKNANKKELEALKKERQRENKQWEKISRELQEGIRGLRDENSKLKKVNLKNKVTKQEKSDINSSSEKELQKLLEEERENVLIEQQRSQNEYFLLREEVAKLVHMLVCFGSLSHMEAGYNMAVFDLNTGAAASPSLFINGIDYAFPEYKRIYMSTYSSNATKNFRDHVSDVAPDPVNSQIGRF